jgi:riboflavin synthase
MEGANGPVVTVFQRPEHPIRQWEVHDIRLMDELHGSGGKSDGQFSHQNTGAGDCSQRKAYGSGMFTGIIQHVGIVREVRRTDSGIRIVINPLGWDHQPNPGDSIANNGCCLTLVTPMDESVGMMVFDVIPETLSKTTLGDWEPGQRINLERSLRMGDGLDGHQVQGHVDGVGTVALVDSGDGYRVRISLDAELMLFMVPKGSICIDGISLTIADLDVADRWVEVALIPETLARTNLGDRAVGDGVNIEADVLVKTIVHTMAHYQQATIK